MLSERIDKLKIFIANRRYYYTGTFDNELGKKVLADLAKFCRASQSTFHPDPRVHALLEGRKEVWTRIANHLNLSPDELFEIYQQGKNPGD